MSDKRKWNGRAPRDIPQRKPNVEAWCYADRDGLDIVTKGGYRAAPDTTITRLTWGQLRRILRDYGKRAP